MAKKYVSPDTLKAFMVIVKTGLAGKVNIADIVNDLTTADATKPLSAAQGKALKDMIDTAAAADVDAKTLEGLSAADFVKAANIVTDLTAYTPADADGKVAAAALVKALKETVDALQTTVDGKLDGTDILTNWESFSEDKTQLVAAALVKAIKEKADDVDTRVTAIEADYVKAADVTDAVSAAKDELNTEIVKKADATDVTALGEAVTAIQTDYIKTATADAKYVALTQKGEANGVAPLDAEGKVAAEYLPSYVDDVIEGYLGDDGVLYEEEGHTTAITGERGKIYVDLGSANNQCYRWSGSTYIKVSDNDMVEITADEVETLWNEAVAANA